MYSYPSSIGKWKPTWTDNGWSDELECEKADEGDDDKKPPAAGRFNKLGRTAGDDIERPMGSKKFKHLKSEAASIASIATTNAETANVLIASDDRLAGGTISSSLGDIVKQARDKRKYTARKDRIKQMMLEMAKMYRDIGDMEECKKYMDNARRLQEE